MSRTAMVGEGGITEARAKRIPFDDKQSGGDLHSRCTACGHSIWTFASYRGARPRVTDHNRAKGAHRDAHYRGLFSNEEIR